MNFGQGGKPNPLPWGSPETLPPNLVGGARGPAALPSRSITSNGPAPAEPLIGPSGAVSFHRGIMVEDAGAPRLSFDGVLGHGSIAWSRPVYSNAEGVMRYHPPTQMPSWTANSDVAAGPPTSSIPVQTKRIANMTVREEYGSTRELYNNGSLATFVASIQVGTDVQGRRWLSQRKTMNPWQPNLSVWGPAGSYGGTTRVLATAPSNVPMGYATYGAY